MVSLVDNIFFVNLFVMVFFLREIQLNEMNLKEEVIELMLVKILYKLIRGVFELIVLIRMVEFDLYLIFGKLRFLYFSSVFCRVKFLVVSGVVIW